MASEENKAKSDQSDAKKDSSVDSLDLESSIDEDESKNVSLLDNLEVTNIHEMRVRIGSESMVFDTEDLKQFSYFEAFLSERWKKHHQSNTIQISDKTDLFGINHFKLLIDCIKCNEIPRNKILTLKDLECLINCADYFCTLQTNQNKNNNNNNSNGNSIVLDSLNPCAVITKTKLKNYFKNRKPPITITERKRWIIESKNKLISQSMYEYNEFLNQQLSLMRGNSLNLHLLINDQQLTTIQFDSDTAASLFFHKFKFSLNKEKTKLKIKIKGYNKEQWDHLIKLFNFQDYWHYFGKDISYIVEKLLYWTNIASGSNSVKSNSNNMRERSYIIECDPTEALSIREMLETVLKSMCYSGGAPQSVNIPSNITRYSLIVSLFSLNYYRDSYFPDLFYQFGWCSRLLSKSEIEEFTKLIMRSHFHYLNCAMQYPFFRENVNNWYKLFMHLLRRCSEQFLVDHSNAKLWFPILHQKPQWLSISNDKMIKFIFDKIIAKFSTQGAFNFALYLVDYTLYRKKHSVTTARTKPLCQRYITFLNDCGITWNLLPSIRGGGLDSNGVKKEPKEEKKDDNMYSDIDNIIDNISAMPSPSYSVMSSLMDSPPYRSRSPSLELNMANRRMPPLEDLSRYLSGQR